MSDRTKTIKVIKGRKPKITVIGGGTGLPVILHSLHKLNADITAIVTVADNGGSSGAIRNYINVVPPGDIRNVLASLSDWDQLSLDVFQYRFNSDDSFLAGHAIGNLVIAALSEMYENDIFDAVQQLSRMMQVDGHVFPAANAPLTLHAQFTDGSTLAGEHEITYAGKDIERVWVTDTNHPKEAPQAVLPVLAAIMQADVIVLGPGSLFTSILPNLMINNVKQALQRTSAEVVYICNIMTQIGETVNFTDADHVRVLNQHLGGQYVDTVLVNGTKVPIDYMDHEKYNEYLVQVGSDFAGLREQGCRVITDDYLSLHDGGAFHDGDKVACEVLNLAFQVDARNK
ncbi:uridine diphosphate-N-acetylglucosamine-binding protein YvcK [Bombilactobacillus folatiphilus]|uniref:Putative gluconeogenesis factor n=1 Tax=Bombilactobacillus folatiphilus TaxID=2923362 RepID=A0ABY4P7J5_9LACO|nr:uridine diphosphate-N-acetylglucosamine-binding protein YvcK [Bombilactobacillus folatiphilus]UQS81678.1 uridine diphosphate-N-acetylglucosamine-binding protein YvcK [Bombilactobacillus folatiphilus]